MPIDKRSSKDAIIKELMDAYKNTGKIGNIKPESIKKAQQIASAIAYGIKGESFDQLIPIMKYNVSEFTEEPDAFETESERQLQKDLEDKIDVDYKQFEKKRLQFFTILMKILENAKKYLDIDFIGNENRLSIDIYFNNRYSFNRFMAIHKNSNRFNMCLRLDFPKYKKYENLNKDEFGARYLTIYAK